jgi:hypothetical protein
VTRVLELLTFEKYFVFFSLAIFRIAIAMRDVASLHIIFDMGELTIFSMSNMSHEVPRGI